MRTKTSGRLLGVAAMTALAMAGAPAAHAAPSSAARSSAQTATITVPAGANSATQVMGGATVTVVKSAHPSVAVLTCTVSEDKPYHGTAGVNGVIWAHCNSNAATLSFGTALYYYGTSVSQNNATVHNCTFCDVTVTAPYQPGQWKSGAILGYFDSSGNGQFTSDSYSATVTL
jgi:hypothetical protein